MFHFCYELKFVNVSSFDTSKITRMSDMFSECKSLTSLNLSNFNTSLVNYFGYIFNNCSSLESLDLSNFDTSSTTQMMNMFSGCSKLKYLNINNFNTSKVNNMSNLFYNCSSLLSLNLTNFDTSNTLTYNNMFNLVNPNLTYCIDDRKTYKSSSSLSSFTKDCNYICSYFYNQRFIKDELQCINNCTNDEKYIYEYNNICYENCPNGTYNSYGYLCEKYYTYNNNEYFEQVPEGYYIENELLKLIEKCDNKCKNCTKDSVNDNNKCISCNKNDYYYPIKDSVTNFIDCYNNKTVPDGYFLDNEIEVYSLCFSNCKKCTELGTLIDQKCTSCYTNYTLNETNCYEICDYYYSRNECPEDYSKLIAKKNQCIKNCETDEKYQYEYNEQCYEECPLNTKLINGNKLCLDNCSNHNKYNYDYKNKCYEECPYDSKLIINTNICIDDCSNSNENKYEYKNKCYIQCPNNTKLIYDTNLCIDKCLNHKQNQYEYNNICYNKCPDNTYFYNEDKYCYDKIPEGFYCNDTTSKTLDKCHENCKTCKEGSTINNNNCLTCKDTGNIYLYLGNCTNNCTNGYLIYQNSIKMCKCLYNKKCNYCSEKSIELDLCINCNKEDGYYQKSDEDMTSEGFINCYKEPEGYYLENNLYQKCNESCKYCSTLGNQNDQKCLECYENYTLINDFDNFSNCYPNCDYYYYYNMENNNNYECTSENKCPEKYSKIIKKKKRCINECYNDNIYKYEYNSFI